MNGITQVESSIKALKKALDVETTNFNLPCQPEWFYKQVDERAKLIRSQLKELEEVLLRQETVAKAAEITLQTGRKHIVREDYGKLTICPMYAIGYEGYLADAGYIACGVIVKESL